MWVFSIQHMKIDWKSDDKNLTKMYPREIDPDDEDSIAEPGSFFNFFEQESDPMDVSDIFFASGTLRNGKPN